MGQPRTLHVDSLLVAGVLSAVLGIAQFSVCLPVAMNHYPGGTYADPKTIGYSWSGNWLSDLGRVTAINGNDNSTSARIFNTSIVTLGVSLLVFFLASIRAFEEQDLGSISTMLAGLFASIGLIGIGLTPVDIHYGPHIASLLAWIVPMLCLGGLFTYQCFTGEGWFGWIIAVATSALFCGVIVYALSTTTTEVMAVQKILVLQSIAWFALLSVRVAVAALYVVQQTRTRMQIANEQAGDYMSAIQRRHRKNR